MTLITINDQAIEFEGSMTILDAARKGGINIPTLCEHPKLTNYGSCRLCLVEVEGAKKLMPSCTVAATEGMVVRTETHQVKNARKFVLSMLFSERNHFCMYCQDTDGDCELQQAAYAEGMTHWPITPPYLPFQVDASHPDFILDNNRCILCRRCVRACTELVGNATLGFEERGSANLLIADDGAPLGESTCISCGNCVQICPTGAFIDRYSAYQGRETDLQATSTLCMECSVGCQRVVKTRDNRLVRIDGDTEADFNEGLLCEYGRYSPLKEDRKRVTTPLVRKQGQLMPASWEEALTVVSAQLKDSAGDIAASISPRQSLEAMDAFYQYFAEGFKAEHINLLGHDESAAVSAALVDELGSFESDLSVLKDCDAAIVLGTDMITDHQVAGFMLKRQAINGLKIILATAEPNDLARMTSDKLVYTGADYVGLIDLLKRYTSGAAEDLLAQSAARLGLDHEIARTVLQDLSQWQKTVVVIGKDFARFENLAAVKDMISFAQSIDAKIVVLKGKANNYAAALAGFALNAHAQPHKFAYMALGDGHACEHQLEALQNTTFKVIQASYMSEFTDLADVVLPSTTWAEETGHYLSTDGKLGLSKQVLQHADNVRTTLQIMTTLAAEDHIILDGQWASRMTEQAKSIV